MLRWIRKKIIVISPTLNDIQAVSCGKEEVWESGKSVYGALGSLVFNHQERFGVKIHTSFKTKPEAPTSGPYVSIPKAEYDTLIEIAKWSTK